MSSLWKLEQARYMLARSREHKDYFLGDPGDHRTQYEFYVDATMHALFGVKDHLRTEFAHAVSPAGVVFKEWFKQCIDDHLQRDGSTLAFLFKKGRGVRHISTHQEPLLLSAQGTRSYTVAEDGMETYADAQMDYFFQDLQMDAADGTAPEWKRIMSQRTVDGVLQEALDQLTACVREAFELFEDNTDMRAAALKFINELENA